MSPEELFKIEDTEIPEISDESVVSSADNGVEKKKIDIFDKDLTIEDLMDFLKKNNIASETKIVEKYYGEIITNNEEKETLTEIIKTLDSEKEILIKEIEVEPNNQMLLKKISDLDEKISDLNTEERIKEDNVKTIIREMSKVNVEKIQTEIINETNQQQPQVYEAPEIIPEQAQVSQEYSEIIPEQAQVSQEYSEIIPEQAQVSQEYSEIIPEQAQTSDIAQISPEEVNQTSDIEVENEEEVKKSNFLDDVNIAPSSEEEKKAFEDVGKNETLEEIKKNNEMLGEMSKNINYNLELVLKAISENVKESDVEGRSGDMDTGSNYTDSPKISQPQYIDEYRKSLRKYGGMESFMGYDIPLKGDNLGSYV
jgi:hypothetical protein